MNETNPELQNLFAELQATLEILETDFGEGWILNPRCWNVQNEYTRRQYLRIHPDKRSSIQTWSGLWMVVVLLENFVWDTRYNPTTSTLVSQGAIHELQLLIWTLKVNYVPCLIGYAKDYCELLAQVSASLLKHVT